MDSKADSRRAPEPFVSAESITGVLCPCEKKETQGDKTKLHLFPLVKHSEQTERTRFLAECLNLQYGQKHTANMIMLMT